MRDGELLARTPRVDWAKLLRRTFIDDVLVCPRCTGRARIVAAVHDPAEARRFLTAIDERSLAPSRATRRADDIGEDNAAVLHEDPFPDECKPPPASVPEPPDLPPPDD